MPQLPRNAGVFAPVALGRRHLLVASRGSVIDLTAFPVAEGEDAWPADQALSGISTLASRPTA